MRRLLLLLLSVSVSSLGQTINAASCSQTDVQNAINAASTGYTVNVPAGSCSWTSLTLSEAITFNGAGQGTTTGSDASAAGGASTTCTSSTGTCIDVSGGNPVFTITHSSAGHIRITNFSFTASSNNNLPHPIEIMGTWPTSYAVIFQNDTFTLNGATMMDNDVAGGLIISHCTFNGGWNDFLMTIKDQTGYPDSWTKANSMGTNDTTGLLNNYIEDTTFNGGSNGVFDCDDNCRIVIRHNTFEESGGFNSHGLDSSNYGMRHFEIYSNSFKFPDKTCASGNSSLSNINQYIWLRGGTGVIYNNNFDSLYSSCWGDKEEINMSIRGAEDDRKDVNGNMLSCGQVTYPVPHQLGQDNNGSSITGGVGDFTDPIYLWGNTGNNGTDGGGYTIEVFAGFTDFGGGANPCNFTWSTFFKWGRDAVNTAVGSATLGSSGGSVEGAGGTAKPGYTPYTYPHPLVGGSTSGTQSYGPVTFAGPVAVH